MIYYKRKSWIKKLILKAKRREVSLPPLFAFLKGILISFCVLILFLYCSYLFLLPKFVTEENIENILNNYLTKNTKFTLDVDNLRVLPDYKFDINIKADKIKLKYPNKKDFLVLQKANVDVNILTLFFNYIDLNKIKADKIIINTNFTKSKRYSCFDYLDLDIFDFENYNSKFQLRNIRILCNDFTLNLYDENIKKSFYIKTKNIKLSSSINKPFIINAKGVVSSSSHKISDFNLNLELLLQKNTFNSFKKAIQKLNYNPLSYADAYKFYSFSDINLKISHLEKNLTTVGSVNLKDYSFVVEGIKLPKNNLLLLFKGDKIKADCNFNFIKNQFIKLNLNAKFNKFIEMKINSNDINLSELSEVISVFLKIINPKINSKDFLLSGFINCNLYLKSDFKTINSNGNLLIKNAKLSYNPLKVAIDSINSNISFDNNKINILNTSGYIDKSKFYLIGSIDNKTNLDLKLDTEQINIAQVINLVKKLPMVIKLDDYIFKTGLLKANAKVTGNIKKPVVLANANLKDLKLFIKSYKTNILIKEILINTKLDNDAFITLNNLSLANEYTKLNASKLQFSLKDNNAILLKAPIKIDNILALIDGKINLKDETALINISSNDLSNNKFLVIKNASINARIALFKTKAQILEANIFDKTKKIISLSGSVDNFEKLNNLKILIEDRVQIAIPSYNLSFVASGNVLLNGLIKSPDVNGILNLYNINYKDLNLHINDLALNIKNSCAYINIINAKVFDINFDLAAEAKIKNNKALISFLNFNSSYINLDNIQKHLNKIKTSKPITLEVNNIKGNISTLELMDTLVNSVNFEGSLNNNILTISKFSAQAFNGVVEGSLKINLANYKTHAETILKGINIRHLSNQFKELSIAASGKLSALITADFIGFDFDNLIKTLNGYVKFNINDGELNQFAKLERFLQAGNILSQSILKLTLNSAISAIAKQNTGDFKTIEGTIKIKDNIANIQYIKTQGTNMSMHITGDFNLLTKFANLKILGRIPLTTVNVLGNIGSFSGGKLVDKMSKDAKEIINSITVSPIEKMMSIPINDEEIANIPPLCNQISGVATREFIVRIYGASQNVSSVKYFKWRQKD